ARLHTQTTSRIYGFGPLTGRFRIRQKKCGPPDDWSAERTIGLGRWPRFQPLPRPNGDSADVCAAFGDTPHRIEEDVDLLVGVVEGERRAHGRLQPQPPQRGLRAVMTRADRDSFGVQSLADLERFVTGEYEGQHAGVLRGGAHQAHTGDVRQSRCRILQQGVLVCSDAFDAQPLHVTQCLGEPDRVGDVSGAGFELRWRTLIKRAFRRPVGEHVASSLPRRRLGQGFLGAVERANSGGAVDLVSGEHEEIRTQLSNVDRYVLDRLGAVDQHARTVAVTQLNNLVDRYYRSQRIGDLAGRNQFGPRSQQLLELVQQQVARVVDRRPLEDRSGLLRNQLPGNDIGVML